VRPTVSRPAAALKAVSLRKRLLRSQNNDRIPAVEAAFNTKLVAELDEKGLSGVKEAMENPLPRSQTTAYCQIRSPPPVTRKEGLANADSPTNLMWRLENDFSYCWQGLRLTVWYRPG
jgi:twitching motility protein PilU